MVSLVSKVLYVMRAAARQSAARLVAGGKQGSDGAYGEEKERDEREFLVAFHIAPSFSFCLRLLMRTRLRVSTNARMITKMMEKMAYQKGSRPCTRASE